jgi:RNA polymerase sigma factor FliA
MSRTVSGRSPLSTDTRWAAFAAGDADARDALLAEHVGLVHFVARQLSRGLSRDADFGELLGAGTLGLIAALESFDPSRGLAFSTFAAPRIRGAILDDLRRLDHASRTVRRKARELAAAREELTRSLGRQPGDRELAARLDLDIPRVWRWEAEIAGAVLVPIDRTFSDDEHGPSLGDVLFDDTPGADELLNREQEVALLHRAIARLNEQERTVLTLCYYEDLKLHEIASVLGVTESRVSQIRSKALARLRAAMTPALVTAA